jgi:hypothetical protein
MISVYKPRFDYDQWILEIVCIKDRSIYTRLFMKKKKADKFYKLAKKKAKKKIILV